MTNEELDNLLAAASPVSNKQVSLLNFHGLDAEIKESIMSTSPEETVTVIDATSRRRSRVLRRSFGAAAALVIAATGSFLAAGPFSSHAAWADSVVQVAQGSPRLLVSAPGWSVERADQFSVGYGEITFHKEKTELEMAWRPLARADSYLKDRANESIAQPAVTVDGKQALVFEYTFNGQPNNEFTAFWTDDTHSIEASGHFDNVQQFDATLASLQEASVDSWLSAMPKSVVKPGDRPQVVHQMLDGVPIPASVNVDALAQSTTVSDHYQLGAKVTSAVACGWIDQWIDAKATNDPAKVNEAAQALASSHSWKVLNDMKSQSGWSQILWDYADAVNGKAAIPSGKTGVTVEDSYKDALGCS